MAGAALDPLAELWVFVFVLANNGDFDAYQPRLSRYHRGIDDTAVVAAVESLRTLYDEVGRREARLAGLGAKKVTRPLTEKYPDLRPLVALFSECHELFGDPNRGREAADLAVQTMCRARKTAITLAFDTQSSRADAIPRKLNACFALKSWRSDDGFLGDGSFQVGIRATELRTSKDAGTSVLTGATAERFEIVKWFYLGVRRHRIRRRRGHHRPSDGKPGKPSSRHRPPGRRRTAAAAGARPARRHRGRARRRPVGCAEVPAADIPARLRRLAPNWVPYRSITGLDLRRYLQAEHAVKVPTTGDKDPVDPAVIRDALTRRDAARPVQPLQTTHRGSDDRGDIRAVSDGSSE